MPEDPTPPQPTEPHQPVEPVTQHQPAEPREPAPATTLPAPAPALPDTGYTPAGVPTFDGVREKIESRYGTAMGATELAEETPEGRTAAQQFDARQKAAEEKLAEIRASMQKPE